MNGNLRFVGAVLAALALIAGVVTANPFMTKTEGEDLKVQIERTLTAIERHQETWAHPGASADQAKSVQQNIEQDRRIENLEEKMDKILDLQSEVLSILKERR